jgi:hypothetical protein
MRPLMKLALASLVGATVALVGCGNTYHPEYHPVSSLTYSQSVVSPVHVTTGGTPQPVYVMPTPAANAVQQLPALPPPPTPPENWQW